MVFIRESAHAVSQMLLHHLFPPRCPSCRSAVDAAGNVCSACFAELHLISAPLCACCGIPFSVPMPTDALCPECLAEPPQFDMARGVMVYNAVAGRMVSALKYHDRMAAITHYAAQMQQAAGSMLSEADALVPVPLHWRRLLWRHYNQSAWLAFALHARTHIPCQPHWLKRVRFTTPQTGMKRDARKKNLRRAFVATPEVVGKRIILVDDVVTTGATANACAKALKGAGAAWVGVLCLARTVKE